MPFVIAAPCIADYSCVESCPVGCIHPSPDDPEFDRVEQLFIDPDTCIGCGACVAACPIDAVFDADRLPARWKAYEQINRDYFTGGLK
ncbi:MAG TPA: 4Fe-4S dicluster domain-containing protein [Gordonia polyisoprenivorans]|uniref:Ferredoxin n=1 Tax=Gordonia polyisoprenivorans TaxID=84595 RepID=A0A846WI85_9ACTN|nr:4Fe-4S dicluster domain-containing protein [Gordonia polyisoprenivorans]MBE7191394.1 4Fe-4S binding protein [Gordonia polyisoprenivorans]NKY01374.1 4Fe-4S binding protein [Gordonia polyisoprenivorans]OZC29657.1 ferredoxin [Gordonia polyisoprenivorans]UZF57980.1 4Fe-4S binding protein [Gordonia polyisoprenivorans]WCB39018.1 4Fe-4S binding protein [Gordonia polyisoprenivorans]